MSDVNGLPIGEQIARAIEVRADADEAEDPQPFDDWSTAHMSGWLEGLREAAQIARETSGWISTSDRLPTRLDAKYLVVIRGRTDVARYGRKWCGPYAGWSDGPLWVNADQAAVDVSDWQEMPGPPLPMGGDR